MARPFASLPHICIAMQAGPQRICPIDHTCIDGRIWMPHLCKQACASSKQATPMQVAIGMDGFQRQDGFGDVKPNLLLAQDIFSDE